MFIAHTWAANKMTEAVHAVYVIKKNNLDVGLLRKVSFSMNWYFECVAEMCKLKEVTQIYFNTRQHHPKIYANITPKHQTLSKAQALKLVRQM